MTDEQHDLSFTTDDILEVIQRDHPEVFKAAYWEVRSKKAEAALQKHIGGFSMPDEPEGEEA